MPQHAGWFYFYNLQAGDEPAASTSVVVLSCPNSGHAVAEGLGLPDLLANLPWLPAVVMQVEHVGANSNVAMT